MVNPGILAWIARHGPLGLGSLLALGVVGVPVPDEILLSFAGSEIAAGRLPLVGTLVAAVIGAAIGVTLSYGAGRLAGARALEAGARRGLIRPDRIASVQAWFQRSGRWGLVVGYFVPGLRHVAALTAGAAKMPFTVFATFAWMGALLWCCTFVTIGMVLGREWRSVAAVMHHHLIVLGLAATAVVALFTTLQLLRARERARRHDGEPVCPGPPRPREGDR